MNTANLANSTGSFHNNALIIFKLKMSTLLPTRIFFPFFFLLLLSISVIAEQTVTNLNKGRNPDSSQKAIQTQEKDTAKPAEPVLGINTADVREDTSSVQFLDLFKSAIPFQETVPWGSSKEVEYDEYGWPTKLNDGKAGTKFLNRLPQDTVEDGFFTVLYDGEGEIFYGNDARLVVHRPNKDIIEIKSGKDKILNASLFIRKSNPDNYIRNIRILPEGGICKGAPDMRVKSETDCGTDEYLAFEDHHLNPWAAEQTEERQQVQEDNEKEPKKVSDDSKVKAKNSEQKEDKKTTTKSSENNVDKAENKDKEDSEKKAEAKEPQGEDNKIAPIKIAPIKGTSDIKKAILFNPEYLNFMKDFQLIRYMNMSGMTRNPVKEWKNRNTLKKASWGGKYGSRGAPVEIMVALSNQLKAHAWFSMPYKASDDYIQKFGEYVEQHLHESLKAYIEYSNEVWNPIFIHHDYAIKKGLEKRLDKRKSWAGYKWYSLRSVETFKIWQDVFGGTDRLVRVMGSWASNPVMTSTVLSYKDAYKHTDAVAIGPYFAAHPRVLRRAKNVDDVFKAMLDKRDKWSMESTINYIKKQARVARSYGVDLVAYEGGQHLVDWNTRKKDEHPNQLLYDANRDPRMGVLYDELMREWHRAGGKVFVAFSAPRIYSWYGSWGLKEHIRQPREEAPKYDALLRYLNARLYPKKESLEKNTEAMSAMSGEQAEIPIAYAKQPQMIWNMDNANIITSDLKDNSERDFAARWQSSWDSKNLYISVSISDDSIHEGDSVSLTLDTTSEEQLKEQYLKQQKIDIENEKKLLVKKKKEQAERKKIYKARAKAEAEAKKISDKEKETIEVESKIKSPQNSKSKPNKIKSEKKVGGVKTGEKNTPDVKDTDKNTLETKTEKLEAHESNNEKETSADKSDSTKDDDKEKANNKEPVDKENPGNISVENNKSSQPIEEVTKAIEKELKASLEKTKDSSKNKQDVTNTVAKKEDKTALVDESEMKTDTKPVTEDASANDKTEKQISARSKQQTIKTVEKNLKEEMTKQEKSTKEDNTISAKKPDADKTTEAANDDQNKEKKEIEKNENENVKTFVFTPFDEETHQARSIITDSGYLLTIAIPWDEVYAADRKVVAVPGNKIGINLVITDLDDGERGNKVLRSANTSVTLPKLVLKSTLLN